MVRDYSKVKKYKHRVGYTEDDVVRALLSVQEGMSIRKAAISNHVPFATLRRRVLGIPLSPGRAGAKPALGPDLELSLAHNIATLDEFGLSFGVADLQNFVKKYLDDTKTVIKVFKDNMPGVDWAAGFLKRHATIITKRQNHEMGLGKMRKEDPLNYDGGEAVSPYLLQYLKENPESSVSHVGRLCNGLSGALGRSDTLTDFQMPSTSGFKASKPLLTNQSDEIPETTEKEPITESIYIKQEEEQAPAEDSFDCERL